MGCCRVMKKSVSKEGSSCVWTAVEGKVRTLPKQGAGLEGRGTRTPRIQREERGRVWVHTFGRSLVICFAQLFNHSDSSNPRLWGRGEVSGSFPFVQRGRSALKPHLLPAVPHSFVRAFKVTCWLLPLPRTVADCWLPLN